MMQNINVCWIDHLPVLVARVSMRHRTVNLGHLILMNHKAWGERATYRHQVTHVEQLIEHCYLGYIIPWLFSRRFRLRMDADAYRVELACSEFSEHPEVKERLAKRLAREHRIGVDRARMILSMTRGCPV